MVRGVRRRRHPPRGCPGRRPVRPDRRHPLLPPDRHADSGGTAADGDARGGPDLVPVRRAILGTPGQQLDANTTIADMTVMSDTFRARVEGVVYGAVLVSITPVGDDTYETTLSLDRRIVNDLRSLYIAQLSTKRN